MTQLSQVKQNIHEHKDKSCNLKNTKTNSRPNRAVWTVFVNCANWRGSTLAIYKTVLIIFPLNLQTITITLDVAKWKWGGDWTVTAAAGPTTTNRNPTLCLQTSHLLTLYFNQWLLTQGIYFNIYKRSAKWPLRVKWAHTLCNILKRLLRNLINQNTIFYNIYTSKKFITTYPVEKSQLNMQHRTRKHYMQTENWSNKNSALYIRCWKLTANLLLLLFAPRHPFPRPLICPAEKFVDRTHELQWPSFGWGTCIPPPGFLCHKQSLHIKAVALMRAQYLY